MNQEECLKCNILQKRSRKELRGFRWKKQTFKLYHDKIIYSRTENEMSLGEIPLICISEIKDYENERNRFDIIMGTFRTFQFQTATPVCIHYPCTIYAIMRLIVYIHRQLVKNGSLSYVHT